MSVMFSTEVLESASAFLAGGTLSFLKATFFGAVGGYLLARARHLKSKHSAQDKIDNYEYPLLEPAIQETFYWPKFQMVDGEPALFWDQQIIGVGKTIMLKDVFIDEHDAQILDYFLKAFEKCTPDEPIVFLHLKKVIPEKHFDAVMDAIGKQWQNYFSAHFNVKEKMPNHERGSMQRPVMRLIFPLLTFQGEQEKTLSRIVIIYDEFTKAANDINIDRVRFDCGAGCYEDYDPDNPHPQSSRFTMNQKIADILNSPDNEWLKRRFGIQVPTGELITVTPEDDCTPCDAGGLMGPNLALAS